LGAPAATRDGTADEQKATLAVYPVRRSDTLAVMHFTVAVDTNADDGIFVFDLFGDGDSTTGDASSSTRWTEFDLWTAHGARFISRPATAKAIVYVAGI
jgi:hypothetical protein